MLRARTQFSRTLSLAICLLAPSLVSAQSSQLYTQGHGDLVFGYNQASDSLEAFWVLEDATVGGQVVEEERPLSAVTLTTSATFTRPASADFAPIGVGAGQSVFYLPQSSQVADEQEVPFLGVEFEAPGGVFVDDSAQLRLISVTDPANQPVNFALWSTPGFSPSFSMSTADGISAQDSVRISEHAHYNLAFGPANQPGKLRLEFEVRAQKTSGALLTDRFVVNVQTCTGSCAQASRPAPALGGFGALALGLGLAGGVAAARRRHSLPR